MKRPEIAIIVAMDENNAIGKDQQLLAHLPNDLKHFKNITSGHTVVMGRKTFESLPSGALPNRKNIVLSSNPAFEADGITVCGSLGEAIALCEGEEAIFIIGGASVYKEALRQADVLYLTRIYHVFEGADTFFPHIDNDQWRVEGKKENGTDDRHPYPYTFFTLKRR